jgi:hypothetical protein
MLKMAEKFMKKILRLVKNFWISEKLFSNIELRHSKKKKIFKNYSHLKKKKKFIKKINLKILIFCHSRLEAQGSFIEERGDQIIYHKQEETFLGLVGSYVKWFPYFDREILDLWNDFSQYMRTK